MTTQPIATAAASASTSGSEAVSNPKGTLGQNDFLKLMIAQLQAQNPLEPGNTNEYVSELAQFTQVEQTTNLANANELSSAVGLIGRTVNFTSPSASVGTGKVESVQSDSEGTTVTVAGISGVKLASITEVQ